MYELAWYSHAPAGSGAAVCRRHSVKHNSSRSCSTEFLQPFNTSHLVFVPSTCTSKITKNQHELSETLSHIPYACLRVMDLIFHLGHLSMPLNKLFQPVSPIPWQPEKWRSRKQRQREKDNMMLHKSPPKWMQLNTFGFVRNPIEVILWTICKTDPYGWL